MGDDNYEPFEDEYWEPVGSCDECGRDLYADDVDGRCDQCLWWAQAASEAD